ncbi:MAG: NAD(P)H-dependent glycerol-3-phosphate dehydrogenase [Ostreibacterium sp.]
MQKVAVIGAGSWGTALAINCTRLPNQTVYLWGHQASHLKQLQKDRKNNRYLPDIIFPENLTATDDISIIYDCDMVLLVVPSIAFGDILACIKPYFSHQAIGWAIKGFDKTTNNLLSHTFTNVYPNRDYAIIAGPSFAKEVAIGLPTAITVAGNTLDFATDYASFLHNDNLRTYTTDDIIGVQIGGALKNVIAIAAGIADGLGFGANTRAALITRGLSEINRIGCAVGAKPETLAGLSGLGDLMLTATDNLSRNRQFGLLLGKGHDVNSALKIIGQTVEGITTAREADTYARKHGVRSPIITIVENIISGKLSVDNAMKKLLSHQPKPEID